MSSVNQTHPKRRQGDASVPPSTTPLLQLVEANKRDLVRRSYVSNFSPVSFIVQVNGETIPVQIVNYHFQGACLKTDPGRIIVLREDARIDFNFGMKCIRNGVAFRVCWESIQANGCFGVEFNNSLEEDFKKFDSLPANSLSPPTLVSNDPINPNRQIYFRVSEFSRSEMIITTSATNSFLFPGMSLDQVSLTIPGEAPIELKLFIDQVSPSDTPETILLQVAIKGQEPTYQKRIAEYALKLSPHHQDDPDRLETIVSETKFFSKSLRKGLTYRVIDTEVDYTKVLKLRYLGYSKAGKVKPNKTWQDMGKGLQEEGTVLGAFLGGQLVASVELRDGGKQELRILKDVPTDKLSALNLQKTLEPNKLVVHPRLQGTDVVVGLLQKIHATAVLSGGYDILMFATDKLLPFYKRIGMKELGIKVSHPVLPGEKLNLMVNAFSAYGHGQGMNPYFFSELFEVTHTLFVDLGLAKPIRETPLRKLRRFAGKTVWTLVHLKKTRNVSPKVKPKKKQLQTFIDPKWTLRHFNASVLVPYIYQAEEMIGPLRVGTILSNIGIQREYLFSQQNWVSIAFFNHFIDEFKKYGNLEVLQRESGRRAMDKKILGLTYYYLKHFANMNFVLKSITDITQKFNTTRTMTLSNLQRGRATIEIGFTDVALLPSDPSACLNWMGCIDGVIELTTGKKGVIRKTACCLTGDPACVYQVSWEEKIIPSRSFLRWSPILMGIAVLVAISSLSTLPVFLLICVWTTFFSLGFGYTRLISKYKSLGHQFDQYYQESNERYNDLQNTKQIQDQNYLEARMIEELSKDIQQSDSLTHILNTAVSAICEKFGFNRAFMMLLDPSNKTLKTAAIGGAKNHLDLLWGFTVDVSKSRDNPMVLSSVFHTGQPILISNVDEHKFQFNAASQLLIDRLQTRGFIIVPIPAPHQNWGVIVADKDTSIIDRRDLVMLQRVAQHLGLALDKKNKLEQEERMRRTFQKYVPARVINGVLKDEEPILGGKVKEVTCMFIDIRGFTSLSQKYPAEVILDILNRFFSLVQSVVSSHSGMIDKFLGDGVLVMWETNDILEPCPAIHAVQAARELLIKTEELSDQLNRSRLPRIEIGIGINRGPAIVGNVGSEARMEHTAIGTTVNLASRLEGFCKVYQTQIVISESILNVSTLNLGSEWKIINDVQVRGIEGSVKIGILDLEQINLNSKEILNESA